MQSVAGSVRYARSFSFARCCRRENRELNHSSPSAITSPPSLLPPWDRTVASFFASMRRSSDIQFVASSTAEHRATSSRPTSSGNTALRRICSRQGIRCAGTMASSLRLQVWLKRQ